MTCRVYRQTAEVKRAVRSGNPRGLAQFLRWLGVHFAKSRRWPLVITRGGLGASRAGQISVNTSPLRSASVLMASTLRYQSPLGALRWAVVDPADAVSGITYQHDWRGIRPRGMFVAGDRETFGNVSIGC